MNHLRNEFTHRLLADSGIEKGMRILDVGCGTGDLSIIAAEMVGNMGEVVGIDISESSLLVAENAVRERAIATVKFLKADIIGLPDNIGRFDAIIGRRVLMYQNDAAQSIDCLLLHLDTNGKMVFQESDCMASSLCADAMPLHTRVQSWIWDTVAKEGGNIHIGTQLYSLMKKAGLTITLMRAEAILHTYESGSDLGWVAKAMAPRMSSYGIVTPEILDVKTLDDRLQLELLESNTPFIRDMAFGVCAKR